MGTHYSIIESYYTHQMPFQVFLDRCFNGNLIYENFSYVNKNFVKRNRAANESQFYRGKLNTY